mgnify:CR=1 FL=1
MLPQWMNIASPSSSVRQVGPVRRAFGRHGAPLLGPLRTVFDVDTSVGRSFHAAHQGRRSSPGATVEAEFTLMNTLDRSRVSPVARQRVVGTDGHGARPTVLLVADHADAQGFVDDPTAPTAVACVQTLARLRQPQARARTSRPSKRRPRHLRRRSSCGETSGRDRPAARAYRVARAPRRCGCFNNAPLLKRASLVHGQPGPRNVLVSDGSGRCSDRMGDSHTSAALPRTGCTSRDPPTIQRPSDRAGTGEALIER